MTLCTEIDAVADYLPWDSEFFSHRIARVKGHEMTEAAAEALKEWSRDERIEVLYFLARADSVSSVQIAQRIGFYLTDIRITLTRDLDSRWATAPFEPAANVLVRPAQQRDIVELEAIARRSHRDTRFFSDPRFSRSQAELLYATWIRLECEGKADRVLVAANSANAAVGYVSCKFDSVSRQGQIGLVATAESIRGKGVGKHLLGAAVDWFSNQGARRISVVTQGRNVAAQRLYQRCGFVTSDIQLWLHCWPKES